LTDYATPNLPAKDMAATSAFYQKFGFSEDYVSPGWMILSRGGLQLEFFPYPDLDPTTSSFGSCLRVEDLLSAKKRAFAPTAGRMIKPGS